MNAIEKMEAFGLKPLAEALQKDLVTMYRWRNALRDGRGIAQPKQKLLIDATAGSEHPIEWKDFLPVEVDEDAA